MSAEVTPRPSAAARWAGAGCTGSVALAARYPDDPSEEAEDGTRLHGLSAQLLRGEQIDLAAEDAEVVLPYVHDVQRTVAAAGATREVFIEQRFEWQPNPALAGTPDAALKDYQAQRLTIWDFKSGWRLVEAHENRQLLCYAMILCPPGWSLDLRIVQPRPYHPQGAVRSWCLSWADLQPWWVWIGRAVRQIVNGETELRAGGHCIYCPALAGCPAARDVTLRSIAYAQREPVDLPDDEIGRELVIMRETLKLLELRTVALEETIKVRLAEGRALAGVSMRESRGGRWKWTQEDEKTRSVLHLLTGKDLAQIKMPTPKQLIDRGIDQMLVRSLSEYQPGSMVISTDPDALARRVFSDTPTTPTPEQKK